jgi:hypothetical protein
MDSRWHETKTHMRSLGIFGNHAAPYMRNLRCLLFVYLFKQQDLSEVNVHYCQLELYGDYFTCADNNMAPASVSTSAFSRLAIHVALSARH